MGFIDKEFLKTKNGKDYVILSLNNPTSKNSMTKELGLEFYKTIQEIQSQNPNSIIITGKNDVFSAGGNFDLLKSFATKDYETNKREMAEFYNLFLCIRNIDIPVIGAINGHAIGAAFSFALACDLRVFAWEGKYQFNFVKLGIHPGMGSSYIAKELFGTSLANRLIFLAETLDGKKAFELGICHEAAPRIEVLNIAKQIAENISESGPLALKEFKKNIYNWDALQDALKKEAHSQALNYESSDFKETIFSIEEKKKPNFQGK